MPKDKLIHLGDCIRTGRNACNLTQQELADQSCVAIKTIQLIEKGQMNPSYEILYPCSPANREVLLNTLDYLAEQLLALQHISDPQDSK